MLTHSNADRRINTIDKSRKIGRNTNDEGEEGAEIDAVGVAIDAVVRA